MELSQVSKADFFGKDKMTQFIGVIEDVNDPKQAGRVKVRCVGWHPMEKEGEDGVATEDLPWARVSAPTTHAQQGRVGSKHGLLPGCWVWGFFLDGDDGQDPMVIGSFPFTAKTVTKDLHTRPQEGEKPGTQESQVKGFTQYDGNVRWPNTALQTEKRKVPKQRQHQILQTLVQLHQLWMKVRTINVVIDVQPSTKQRKVNTKRHPTHQDNNSKH